MFVSFVKGELKPRPPKTNPIFQLQGLDFILAFAKSGSEQVCCTWLKWAEVCWSGVLLGEIRLEPHLES